MKKVLSFVLMVVFTLQVATMDVLALGMNQVTIDERGGKHYFVSSDKIDTYFEQLELENEACWQNYNEWHGKGSWKGALINLLPLSVAIVYGFICARLINLYNRYTRKPNVAIEIKENAVNNEIDTSFSPLQNFFYYLTVPIATFLAFRFAQEKSGINMALNCDRIQSSNNYILEVIKAKNIEDDVRTYGMEIRCNPINPLLGYAECLHVQSQKRYYE